MTIKLFASLVALVVLESASFAATNDDLDDWLANGAVSMQFSASKMDFDRKATARFGLVIGNGDYENVTDLPNAIADGKAMATLLRAQGFRVAERYNLSRRGFEEVMRQLLFRSGPDTEVLFYFAGHGIQIGRRNYLLPTDAELSNAYDTPFETVTLDSIVKIIGARSHRQVVILDSCRDNPFSASRMMTEIDQTLFEPRSGFNAMAAPVNSLLAYSTSPGAVALDGSAANSPFTGAFIREANANPGATVRDILHRVRRSVYGSTSGRQVPWESSTLVEPFVLLVNGPASPSLAMTQGDTAGGEGRGLRIVAPQAVVPTTAAASEGRAAVIKLVAPLARSIAIGQALSDIVGATQGDIGVSVDDRTGAVRLTSREAAYVGEAVSKEQLRSLVLEYIPVQRSARGDIDALTTTIPLTLRNDPGKQWQVELQLKPDPCDFEAGDWLDPEGVGLTRYPNEIVPVAAVSACSAAVARAPQTGRFHYQLGRALQANLEFPQARAAFEKARDLGHTRAWHALGDLAAELDSAQHGTRNTAAPRDALDMYAKGVERGDPYAFHALGKQLLRYGRTDAARRYGFELLSQSIELGHTFAMNELGYYFMNDKSEHYEPKRGLRYLQESAAREDIYGYNNLGLVYDNGLGGVPPDANAALDWYTKAADGGHPFAPVNIGRMYFKGKLSAKPDLNKAIEWYDKGLAGGTAWGGANAAWIIKQRKPKGFTQADAAVRAAKAAVLRDADAAKQANSILDGLSKRAIATATQMIVREFVPDLVVDGVMGPASVAAVENLAKKYDYASVGTKPIPRLLSAAAIYWRAKGIRIDLL